MLERIVELSVRRRGVVLVVWALITIAALLAARKLSIDAVPDVTNTQVRPDDRAGAVSRRGRAVPDVSRSRPR